MDICIIFSQKHHITHESSRIKKDSALKESLPWDSFQRIRFIGSDEKKDRYQIKSYLCSCMKEVKDKLKEHRAKKFSSYKKKTSQRLRHAKKSIEKALIRLQFSKKTNKVKHNWRDIQEKQERLMQERWPLIVEREEHYNQFHKWVRPHVASLLSNSKDSLLTAKGEFVSQKNSKNQLIYSASLFNLCNKLRKLEAQLDVYHPSNLPKPSEGNWSDQLNGYLQESLEATICQCPNCRKTISSICHETGKLFCQDHKSLETSEDLPWVHDLILGLKTMQKNL